MFFSDGNRGLVLSSGGCPLLVEQLKSSSRLPVAREFDRLKCVTCGCLLNTVNDNGSPILVKCVEKCFNNMSLYPDKLCKEMLGLGAAEHLSALLARPGEDESTITMGLKALYVLLAAGTVHMIVSSLLFSSFHSFFPFTSLLFHITYPSILSPLHFSSSPLSLCLYLQVPLSPSCSLLCPSLKLSPTS